MTTREPPLEPEAFQQTVAIAGTIPAALQGP